MPALIIDPSKPTHEIAASYLATLAFAASKEDAQRADALDNLCAQALRCAWEEDWPIDWSQASGRHVAMADRGELPGKRFYQKMQQRQRAAALALPELARQEGVDVRLLQTGRPAKPTAVTEVALQLGWKNDRPDMRDHIWRPSLSVLHLTVALRLVQAERQHSAEAFDHRSFYTDPTIVMRAIVLTEPLEVAVLKRWSAQVLPEDLWHIRLAA